jgi:hypothetical protein
MNSSLNTILESTFGSASNYNDLEYQVTNDPDNNHYLVLPISFIKIVSKYLDQYITNHNYYRLVKNIRNRYCINVKFNLTKFQTARIFLETMFKRENSQVIDSLFEQLKLYGNHVLDMNITYHEIIKYIYDCIAKNNYYLEQKINILRNKILNIQSNCFEYDQESITKIEVKIFEALGSIQTCNFDEIEKNVYTMFEQYTVQKIPIKKQELIKEKIISYINNEFINQNHFHNLTDYTKNNGVSLGKSYENIIFEMLKTTLNQHGFEIIKNVELTFTMKFSGIKLEYDFMIGKIVDQTFIVYAVFDAKISNALIQKDIPKFVQSIDFLKENKLTLRNTCQVLYKDIFKRIAAVSDGNIIIGYFCKSGMNYKKEISKAISANLINNGYKTLELINGCHINFTFEMLQEICNDISGDNREYIEMLKKNNALIFNVL